MAMIEYIEPANVGGMFVGIAAGIFVLTIAYIIYRIYIKLVQYFDLAINREAKYEILEEAYLDKIGRERGVDLDKEIIKKKLVSQERKSVRKKLEEAVYQEMFGKEEAASSSSGKNKERK